MEYDFSEARPEQWHSSTVGALNFKKNFQNESCYLLKERRPIIKGDNCLTQIHLENGY